MILMILAKPSRTDMQKVTLSLVMDSLAEDECNKA
jgi:hypothetical protein